MYTNHKKKDIYVDVCTQINQCANTGQKVALENAMDAQEQKIKDFLQACGGSGEVRVYMYVCIYIYTHIYVYTYIYMLMYNISSVRPSHRKKNGRRVASTRWLCGGMYIHIYMFLRIHVSIICLCLLCVHRIAKNEGLVASIRWLL